MDIDNTPLTLQDEEPRIGGWLRFFQVVTYISAILNIAVVILLPVLYFADYIEFNNLLDLSLSVLELIPGVILSVLLIILIPIKDNNTPIKIKNYLGYYLATSFFLAVLLTIMYKSGYVSDKPASVLGTIIFYLIWSTYFNKSKRVCEFYGGNA